MIAISANIFVHGIPGSTNMTFPIKTVGKNYQKMSEHLCFPFLKDYYDFTTVTHESQDTIGRRECLWDNSDL